MTVRRNTFEGWYFKHQCGRDMIAFIPGRAESGAFIQVISPGGSRQFTVPELSVGGGTIYAGNSLFSKDGCQIELPGINGEITYAGIRPLRTDIMGPFRFFPMECRHGVISMAHSLNGSLTIDGERHCFDGGIGYIEKDSGKSFPSSYMWLQCNSFTEPCSVMVSVANIPFCGTSFRGCICAVVYGDREYRLATYNGVRIHAAEPDRVCLSQGKLLLNIEINPSHNGHPLRSPVNGKMSGTIRESSNADIRVRLLERGKPVFDLCSDNAAYEFVPPAIRQ